MTNSLVPVVFHSLCDNPADIEDLDAMDCRALLEWNDRNGEFDALNIDDLRAALYRVVLSETIVAAADAIAASLHARGYCGPEYASYDDLRCIAAARTAGHAEAAECEDWLDDMVARCDLPQDLADDLLAAIADDFHVFNR